MIKNIFRKNQMHDEEQLIKASFFTVSACTHFMMWKKEFTRDQAYYLFEFLNQPPSNRDPVSAAYLITQNMSAIQENTSVMDFLYTSSIIRPLEKSYRKFAIENILIFLFLEENGQTERLSYVSYFYEDIDLGGTLGFHRLINKAYKRSNRLRGYAHTKANDEALEILSDALSRTDYK